MQLQLVENKEEKISAQNLLIAIIKQEWNKAELRRVVWRPNSSEMPIIHNGKYWLTNGNVDQRQTTKTYWNAIGIYQPKGNLNITVEANIPIADNKQVFAGYFAKDERGMLYLMHSGKVGGGRKGIGKSTFLTWSKDRLISVIDGNGNAREGLIIGPVKKGIIGNRIERFAEKVANYKADMMSGYFTAEQRRKIKRDYKREFSGQKSGERNSYFDYVSRHGDIVHALKEWREDAAKNKISIANDIFIDLGVTSGNSLTEIYEVKTNDGRQAIYTAIGQLLVHSSQSPKEPKRFLVIPSARTKSRLSGDLRTTIDKLNITVIRYKISKNKVTILG